MLSAALADLGLAAAKPLLTALVLPPAPMLIAVVFGALQMARRPRLGTCLVGTGVLVLWLSQCLGAAYWVERGLLSPPPALSAARVDELRAATTLRGDAGSLAVLVLGGGRERYAPEYGEASLEWASLERLRYGTYLARAIGSRLGFSGGTGWAQNSGEAEARIAARVAEREFGYPIRWVEDSSRDTRENAARSVALLAADGVGHVLLVTHGWHMPRAMSAFRGAASGRMVIEAAPMGLADPREGGLLDWLPSSKGSTRVRQGLREWLGAALGA